MRLALKWHTARYFDATSPRGLPRLPSFSRRPLPARLGASCRRRSDARRQRWAGWGSNRVTEPLIEQPASRFTALATDVLLTVVCYLAAYRLRFDSTELATFLPSAVRALPLVAASQITALLAFRAYTYRRGRRWFPRLLGGVFLGTAAGAWLTWQLYGFQGISRFSFAVDALLLALAAFGWRAVSAVARLARAAREERAEGNALEDRTAPPSVSAGLLGIVRYRELLRNLVLRDLKLKYRGSVFGFFWSLANPLLLVVTYTVAFTYILQMRTPGFVFTLLLGLLNWNFFANSAMMSTGSVVDAAGLIKSVAFPRAILPVATVLFNLAQFLLTIAVFLPIAVAVFHAPLSPAMLLAPCFSRCRSSSRPGSRSPSRRPPHSFATSGTSWRLHLASCSGRPLSCTSTAPCPSSSGFPSC